MRILNWNTQADRYKADSDRLRSIRERVASYDADVICLTEAYPAAMPNGERTTTSGLSGWGWPEDRGARKVLLWSRNGWTDVEQVGPVSVGPVPEMPEQSALVAGGVDHGTVGDAGQRQCRGRRTIQTDPMHRRCLAEVRSMVVPGDVGQTDPLEGHALDDDTETGLQFGCEVEERRLPPAGSTAGAADDVAPSAPPVLGARI